MCYETKDDETVVENETCNTETYIKMIVNVVKSVAVGCQRIYYAEMIKRRGSLDARLLGRIFNKWRSGVVAGKFGEVLCSCVKMKKLS